MKIVLASVLTVLMISTFTGCHFFGSQEKWDAGYWKDGCEASFSVSKSIKDRFYISSRINIARVVSFKYETESPYSELKQGDYLIVVSISVIDFNEKIDPDSNASPDKVSIAYDGKQTEMVFVPPDPEDLGRFILVHDDAGRIWRLLKKKGKLSLNVFWEPMGSVEIRIPTNGIDTASAMFDACYASHTSLNTGT